MELECQLNAAYNSGTRLKGVPMEGQFVTVNLTWQIECIFF